MNFKPRSEQEIAESQLFPKGVYDFEIVAAFDKLSKSSGRPMIELKVKVLDAKRGIRVVTDYLLEQRAMKLRHAAEACGLLGEYETGELSGRDFLNKQGKLKLAIEKDRTHRFPDKNVVTDYVTGNAGEDAPSRSKAFGHQPQAWRNTGNEADPASGT